MTILQDVLAGLFKMFVGDARLSAAILAVVALAAGLIGIAGLDPLVAGAVLLVGCLAVVPAAVLRAGRRRSSAATSTHDAEPH